MESLYRQQIIDLYKSPLNFKTLSEPDVVVDERNTTCGDVIHLELKLDHDGHIDQIGFQGDGCAISRASASLLTENMKAQPIDHSQVLTLKNIEQWLHIPISPARVNCALLALQALQKAAKQLSQKQL